MPYLEVVVESAGDPGEDGPGYEEVRATVDAVLAGTVPDVVVTVPGPWDRLRTDERAPLANPDLAAVLIRGHYAHEPRVRLTLASPPPAVPAVPYPADDGRGPEPWAGVPYRLRLPSGWVPGEDSLARLLDLAGDEGYGLVSVLLAEGPGTTIVAARLERTAAFARAAIVRAEGECLDDAVEDTFGTVWVDGETYGFLPEAPPLTGRRGAYRARAEVARLGREAARLTGEVERLRGQVGRWHEEAGRWRKSAVELRREVGGLRKELAAARKVVQYGLLSSVKRVITRRR